MNCSKCNCPLNGSEVYLCSDCQVHLFERLYEDEKDEEKKENLRNIIEDLRETDTWNE